MLIIMDFKIFYSFQNLYALFQLDQCAKELLFKKENVDLKKAYQKM